MYIMFYIYLLFLGDQCHVISNNCWEECKANKFWHISNVNLNLWSHLGMCLVVSTKIEDTQNLWHSKFIPELCHTYTKTCMGMFILTLL